MLNIFKRKPIKLKGMITVKKKAFKELYGVACESWQKKFDNEFKSNVFSDEIYIEESFVQEMKSALADEKQKRIFNKLFKDLIDDNVLGVKTYKDVCKKLGEKEVTLKDFPNKRILAYTKIDQIQRFFNGKWKPDFSNSSQNKYYPYFKMDSGGLVLSDVINDFWTCDGLVAYYKSSEIAEHVGNNFNTIYSDLY